MKVECTVQEISGGNGDNPMWMIFIICCLMLLLTYVVSYL